MLKRGQFEQKPQLFLSICDNIDEAFAARYDTAQAQEQDLINWISDSRYKRLKRRDIFQSKTLQAQASQN